MLLPSPKAQLLTDLENVFAGEPWYGESMLTILESVSSKQAMKPLGGRRIYTLLLHMLAWRGYLLRQLQGDADYDIEVDSALDWPPYQDEDLPAWPQALASLQENQRQLVTILRSLPDEQLYGIVPRRKFSFAFLINGLIQHDVYHLGQIALLRRML